MQKLTLLIILLFLASFLQAQYRITWQKTYGGSDSDFMYDIQKFNDGFVLGGCTYSTDGDPSPIYGSSDLWIINTDSLGDIITEKTYGGSNYESISSLVQTADSGCFIISTSASTDYDITDHHNGTITNDIWVVKLDSVLNMEWAKSLGGSFSEYSGEVKIDDNGDFHIVGSTKSYNGDVSDINPGPSCFNNYCYDGWYVKLSSTGTILFEKTFGSTGKDYFNSIEILGNTGFVIAGRVGWDDEDVTVYYGGDDMWFVRLDPAGAMNWQKSIGGTDDEDVSQIIEASDGKYVFVGSSESTNNDLLGKNNGGSDLIIGKLNTNGSLDWLKNYGGTDDDYGATIQETSDGGFIVTGTTFSSDIDVVGFHGTSTYSDGWILKLDANGDLEWQMCVGGTDSDYLGGLVIGSNGKYTLNGYTFSFDGDVINTTSDSTWASVWLFEIDSSSTSTVYDVSKVQSNFNVYPNPSHDGKLNLYSDVSLGTIEIRNTLGQICYRKTLNVLSTQIDVGDLPNGIYYINCTHDAIIRTHKIVLENR